MGSVFFLSLFLKFKIVIYSGKGETYLLLNITKGTM